MSSSNLEGHHDSHNGVWQSDNDSIIIGDKNFECDTSTQPKNWNSIPCSPHTTVNKFSEFNIFIVHDILTERKTDYESITELLKGGSRL